MKKRITFVIDGVAFSLFYSAVEDSVRIYREGMNGGELRAMGGDKWRRFDADHFGVFIVQVAELQGTPVLEVKRERVETLFIMDLTSTKNV